MPEDIPEPRTCHVVAKCSCGAVPPDEFSDASALLWLADHVGLEHVSQPLTTMLANIPDGV